MSHARSRIGWTALAAALFLSSCGEDQPAGSGAEGPASAESEIRVEIVAGDDIALKPSVGNWFSIGQLPADRSKWDDVLGRVRGAIRVEARARGIPRADGTGGARLVVGPRGSTAWSVVQAVIDAGLYRGTGIGSVRLMAPDGATSFDQDFPLPSGDMSPVHPQVTVRMSSAPAGSASPATFAVTVTGTTFRWTASSVAERATALEGVRARLSALRALRSDLEALFGMLGETADALPYADALAVLQAIRGAGVDEVQCAILNSLGVLDTQIWQEAGEPAVELGLDWLQAHQSPDGGWEAATFGRWCDKRPAESDATNGPGKAEHDVGVTGLALLAFLRAGYNNRSEDPKSFGKVVAAGLRYLRNVQDAEGCFGARKAPHYVYGHATATLAVLEAFAQTRGTVYKGPSQKALEFIALARNPKGAWRYGVRPGDDDTSVTAWMAMVVATAKRIDDEDEKFGKAPSLMFDAAALAGARTWIEQMTDPDYGRVGYMLRGTGPARPTAIVEKFPPEKSESMTAAGILVRTILGEDPTKSQAILAGSKQCQRLLPTWNPDDGSIDMYYWWFGTQAMHAIGGASWKTWEAAVREKIVAHQRADGDRCSVRGSWDPIDPWGPDGGRVYSTAIMTLTLEVAVGYPRALWLFRAR